MLNALPSHLKVVFVSLGESLVDSRECAIHEPLANA
jgi:hypothetical protein